FFFILMLRPPPNSPLFPYTTLFRSGTFEPRSREACGSARLVGPRFRRRTAAGGTPGSRDGASCRRRSSHAWSSCLRARHASVGRSEEHTSELQSLAYLVCRLLLEKK